MLLIAESGATKTDWIFGETHVRTKGINPAVMSDADVAQVIENAIDAIGAQHQSNPDGKKYELAYANPISTTSSLFFYGAGLVSREATARLRDIFAKFLPDADMEFESDLMAAARALWGREPGTVAILGSGSNSCAYDGKKITKNVKPGGFILGDEGGGVSVGRRFISDYIKDLVPEPLRTEFAEEYRLNYEKIVEAVYKGRNPSGFLASFAPFVVARMGRSEYARELVEANFRCFIERSLLSYRHNSGAVSEVGVTGSFGCVCRDILTELGKEYDIAFVKFIESPILGLTEYHSKS